ncbi:hypothetical protein [Geodermatophilus pulveris]|uniref:hypothetical protein n=1 Tax=Geodermatophilus pulveris TaxID=1564159 RepID=UPI001FEBDAEC|nr:hypothetical protein [Geodermatophilus pulveris]
MPVTVDHDLLLRWCSERSSGSLTAFREAHDWLREERGAGEPAGPDPRSEQDRWMWSLQSLQALGHLEVDWRKRRWHVAPPVVTTLTDGGGFALLCGARPAALVRRLDNLVDDPDPRLQAIAAEVVFDVPVSQRGGPALRLLQAPAAEDARELCALLGISFVDRTADQLVQVLPDLNGLLQPGQCVDLPGGVAPAKMSDGVQKPLFFGIDQDFGEAGAYEVRLYDAPRYFYRHSPGRVFEAERGAIVWAELRRTERHALRYDAERRTLLVPPRLRLPSLYDRAATLRSGLLPQLEKVTVPTRPGSTHVQTLLLLRYVNIDLLFAERLASLLNQPLQRLNVASRQAADHPPPTRGAMFLAPADRPTLERN